MSRSKVTGSTQKVGSGNRPHSGKSPNTPTRKGAETLNTTAKKVVEVAGSPSSPITVPRVFHSSALPGGRWIAGRRISMASANRP